MRIKVNRKQFLNCNQPNKAFIFEGYEKSDKEYVELTEVKGKRESNFAGIKIGLLSTFPSETLDLKEKHKPYHNSRHIKAKD